MTVKDDTSTRLNPLQARWDAAERGEKPAQAAEPRHHLGGAGEHMSWHIAAPRLTKVERRELAVADQAARRHKKNKLARKALRTNRK